MRKNKSHVAATDPTMAYSVAGLILWDGSTGSKWCTYRTALAMEVS